MELPALRPPLQPPPPEPPDDPPPTRAGAGVMAGRGGMEMCVVAVVTVVGRASGIPPCPAAPFTVATLLCGLATPSAETTWLEFTKRCSTGSYMIDDWRTTPVCHVLLAGRTLETGRGVEVLGIVPATSASAGACLTTDTFSPFVMEMGDALTCPATGYTPCAMLIGVLPFLS